MMAAVDFRGESPDLEWNSPFGGLAVYSLPGAGDRAVLLSSRSSLSLATSSLEPIHHPLQSGQVFYSQGGHFSYRVVGACCRLFDREELPWPCCRIQWRSKEPSWRRIGKRFVPDIATKQSPSYCVEILGPEWSKEPIVITLYSVKLSPEQRNWWYGMKALEPEAIAPKQP